MELFTAWRVLDFNMGSLILTWLPQALVDGLIERIARHVLFSEVAALPVLAYALRIISRLSLLLGSDGIRGGHGRVVSLAAARGLRRPQTCLLRAILGALELLVASHRGYV